MRRTILIFFLAICWAGGRAWAQDIGVKTNILYWATSTPNLGFEFGLGKRWNLEATLGFGYVYTNYDKYDCATCGKFRGSQDKHYFGPTKAGISIIYMIK